jgi:Xaa-Pro dipeptidase
LLAINSNLKYFCNDLSLKINPGGNFMVLEKIQTALKEKNLDGWLFYDFHNRDLLAYRVLGLDSTKMTSRRWYYYIPAEGEPVKLVSAVERSKLDPLPGIKKLYLSWEQQQAYLNDILGTPKKIAMQYSPSNNIPYVSIVDAGTMEIIKGFGHQIISSADLVQKFEAIIDEDGYRSHVEAGKIIDKVRFNTFKLVEDCIKAGNNLTEFDVAKFIMDSFKENNLVWDGVPITGVNDHPADPHFEPTPENSYTLKKGDTLLIDLWGKFNVPKSIFYDITWCGFIGMNPPEKYVKIFDIVKNARDEAVKFIVDRFSKKEKVFGWEVDDVTRDYIKKAGFGQYFVHRTGHSIGEEVHGNGVNIDNLETKDTREIVPGICFSIEPGIYLDGEMAARSEINVFITLSGQPVVSGEKQEKLILMDV